MSSFALTGIMGWPVGHSRSPLLHGYWLKRYGIVGAYVPLAVPSERLAEAVRALPLLGFVGCNVTLPHKEAVFHLVDRADAAAQRTRSVNLVVVGADGSLEGRSTDGAGFVAALREAAPFWRPGAAPVALIGAGGAARAIAPALLEAGEAAVRLINRTDSRTETLALDLGMGLEAWSWAARREALAGCHLLVNTTSAGMSGTPPLDLDLALLPRAAIVSDIVYVPLETPLLAAARGRGNLVVDGLGMLLHQARPAFAAWFGIDPVVDQDLRVAILETLPK